MLMVTLAIMPALMLMATLTYALRLQSRFLFALTYAWLGWGQGYLLKHSFGC